MTATRPAGGKPEGACMSSQAAHYLPLLAVLVVMLGILFLGVCLMLGSIFKQVIRDAGELRRRS